MFERRLNRAPYVLAYLASNVLAVATLIVVQDKEIARGVAGLFVLAILLPLTIRRLHDIDMSGWLALLLFIPLVGSGFALYLCFAKGTEGENRFGDDPLGGGPVTLPTGSMGLALSGSTAAPEAVSTLLGKP